MLCRQNVLCRKPFPNITRFGDITCSRLGTTEEKKNTDSHLVFRSFSHAQIVENIEKARSLSNLAIFCVVQLEDQA